jgi:MATE family multidrug resistance protein
MTAAAPLTHRRVLSLAWPVVLAQMATAMTGVVDTGLMGRYGDAVDLAAVGIAAVTFSFVYWAFGFLRMATTGLTAQSEGAGDSAQARAHLQRALIVGALMGALIVAAFPWIERAALASFQAEADVEGLAAQYYRARIWGAPAALMGYAVTGWLLGTGQTRRLLLFQIVLNGVNAILDVWFVAELHWGPAGIGAGTAIAEWVALGCGLVLVRAGLRRPATLLDRAKLVALFAANRDILIRTLALLFSFAWFANSGARVSTIALAGNEVLLQFIAVAAFVLDAFAFIAEKEIGGAFGARDPARVRHAMRVTTELALACGFGMALLFFVSGGPLIRTFVLDPQARAAALQYLPYCAVVPILGVPAWQLDGAFLGATRGAALRTAAVVAMTLYITLDLMLAAHWGNTGVWIAFLTMYVSRAACLAVFWPGLVRAATPTVQSTVGDG